MRSTRALILVPLALHLTTALPQAVRQKHLVMSLGVGVGLLHMASDRTDLDDEAIQSGAIRFAFGYAITDRWSLGIHYDRIGTAFHDGALERLHVTTYMVEGSYRPWTGERATVECTVGLGAMAASLFPYNGRLPYTAGGGAFALGVRYMHLVTGTLGLFAALDHATTSSNELLLDGGTVNADGSSAHVQWNNQRLSAGLAVRF